MRKTNMTRFILCPIILLLILTSCTPIPDEIPGLSENHGTDDDHTDTPGAVIDDGYRDVYISNDILRDRYGIAFDGGNVIALDTNEVFSACNDPLCDHTSHYYCAERILSDSSIMVSPSSTPDDLILYLSRRLVNVKFDEETQTAEGLVNDQILRYHYYTGELVVLCENLLRFPNFFGLDPKTENIFFSSYAVNDAGESENTLYILNGKTGEMRTVPTSNRTFDPAYMVDDVLHGYLTADDMVYSIDLSSEEPVLEETGMRCKSVYDRYAYYTEKVGEERLYVTDDVRALCEQYGDPYKDFSIYDFYRVNIMEEDAEPELIARGVSEGNCTGKYVYYYEYVTPQYIESYLTFRYGTEVLAANRSGRPTSYPLGDPDAPENMIMRHSFSKSDGEQHVLDMKTLEPVAESDAK